MPCKIWVDCIFDVEVTRPNDRSISNKMNCQKSTGHENAFKPWPALNALAAFFCIVSNCHPSFHQWKLEKGRRRSNLLSLGLIFSSFWLRLTLCFKLEWLVQFKSRFACFQSLHMKTHQAWGWWNMCWLSLQPTPHWKLIQIPLNHVVLWESSST